jgi:hypothetical protein
VRGIRIRIIGGLIVASLAGCATERFGREQRLTYAEKAGLTCEQIDLQIAKVDGFLADTEKQWEATRRRISDFDFGIGNQMEYGDAIESEDSRRQQLLDMEYGDAIESADARRQQLLDLRAGKQCPGAPAPRPSLD